MINSGCRNTRPIKVVTPTAQGLVQPGLLGLTVPRYAKVRFISKSTYAQICLKGEKHVSHIPQQIPNMVDLPMVFSQRTQAVHHGSTFGGFLKWSYPKSSPSHE